MACHDKPPRRNSPGPTRALIPGRRKAAGTYTACIAVRITYLPTSAPRCQRARQQPGMLECVTQATGLKFSSVSP